MTLALIPRTSRTDIDSAFRRLLLSHDGFGAGVDDALRSKGTIARKKFVQDPTKYVNERIAQANLEDSKCSVFEVAREAGFILGMLGIISPEDAVIRNLKRIPKNFFERPKHRMINADDRQAEFIRSLDAGFSVPLQLDAYVNWRRDFLGNLFPPKNSEIDFVGMIDEGPAKRIEVRFKADAMRRMADQSKSDTPNAPQSGGFRPGPDAHYKSS